MSTDRHCAALAWGRHYVMVEPDHFRVDYVINPFMDPADQPDPARAREQWEHLVATIERPRRPRRRARPARRRPRHGLRDEPRPRPGPRRDGADRHVVMSHMRYPERRMETAPAQPWFAERGFTTSYVGRDGVGAHFEAGDAFAFGDALVVGYGPRTEELALKHLATDLGVRVRGLRITHPGMYHLDLAFCPLDERRAMVCPAAFDEASAAALLDLVPEPLVLTEEEALTTFCANSIVIGSHRRDAGLPRPGARPARGVGLRDRARRRVRVPQGRRLDPLPDQPGRRTHRPRPARRPRRRGRWSRRADARPGR